MNQALDSLTFIFVNILVLLCFLLTFIFVNLYFFVDQIGRKLYEMMKIRIVNCDVYNLSRTVFVDVYNLGRIVNCDENIHFLIWL